MAKEEGGEEVEVEAESESLASVRCKGLVMELLLETNFGAGFENCRGFVTVMNLDADEKEEHFKNMVPQGARIHQPEPKCFYSLVHTT